MERKIYTISGDQMTVAIHCKDAVWYMIIDRKEKILSITALHSSCSRPLNIFIDNNELPRPMTLFKYAIESAIFKIALYEGKLPLFEYESNHESINKWYDSYSKHESINKWYDFINDALQFIKYELN